MPITNIAGYVTKQANDHPSWPAIYFPTGRDSTGKTSYLRATFKELDTDSDRIASGLLSWGLQRGTRAVLMVKPSLEFFALTFGLFKAGIVPVLIDPGIDKRSLKECLDEAEPEAFIGVPLAHAARVALGWGKKTIKKTIWVGGTSGISRFAAPMLANITLDDIKELGNPQSFTMTETKLDEVAAVLFTSGSTGTPKGAVYTHGTFIAQVESIRDTYDIEPGEIDLPTFPLFALFDPAFGMTTVIPDMDFTKPASVDPRHIFEPIEEFHITNMFGSPALIDTVSRYAERHDLRVKSLKRVISAGAPVRPDILERMRKMLPDGCQVFTPYGATESLPVATIGSDEILNDTAEATSLGKGVCVGKPVEIADVSIIQITDEAITTWSDDLVVQPGQIGEIFVRGPQVTTRYHNRDLATRQAKIYDEAGAFLGHRMGDLGYFDETGRIWFCGRKKHRVETADGPLYTTQVEGIFNSHPRVFRSALVGLGELGEQHPVICIEVETDDLQRTSNILERYTDMLHLEQFVSRDGGGIPPWWEELEAELKQLAEKHDLTKGIDTFLWHPSFPTDIRHNAKINREVLAVWAKECLHDDDNLAEAVASDKQQTEESQEVERKR